MRSDLTPIAAFHPAHVYSIFGNDEQIFGYKDLEINLRFQATDMRPNLQVLYSKQFKGTGETQPTDIEAILGEHLPQGMFNPTCANHCAY